MEIKRTANAGILLTLDGVKILLDGVCHSLDPYLGTKPAERMQLLDNPPDAVVFTHNHPDHCDVSFVSEYLQKAAGPIMGPADIPFSSHLEQTVSGVKITPIPSRHLGKFEDVQHFGYVIQGSRCIWFMGDAGPLQFKQRQDLPQPDIMIAPFAYAIGSGWDITRQISPKAFVLVHMPTRENDPADLWSQVEQTVKAKPGPAIFAPNLGQRIQFEK